MDWKKLVFDLSDTLTINKISIRGNDLNYTLLGDHRVEIELENSLNISEVDSFSIEYEGRPHSIGLGSFKVDIHGDNVPVLWTLSEPFGAREWWPCKQTMSDKVDSCDIIVTCPEMYKTASNGLIVEETVTAGNRTMHWRHRYPIATYLIAIAVTNYEVLDQEITMNDGSILKFQNFCYPESKEEWEGGILITSLCMEYFSDTIGPYPFMEEKYGHAQFSRGGGMEHQTMSLHEFNVPNFDWS